MTGPDLAELQRLAEAAQRNCAPEDAGYPSWYAPCEIGGVVHRIDAVFIAAANPAAVLALLAERDALAAKVERVRALHTPRGVYETASHGVMWHCLGCERNYSSNTSSPVPPCPTIRALDEEPQP